ncbi:MAG: gamma subclass chorismate mutase AroQ, partial [Lewinella sp.]|nr:gamma subclass chorismate mutase AroQ [Lewinella sp.]
WNPSAWIALVISLLPVLPGFLSETGVLPSDLVPDFLRQLYTYAWFITFFLAFVIYWLLNSKIIRRPVISLLAALLLAFVPVQSTRASRFIPPIAVLCPESTVTVLADLVNQRLSYMKDVAAYKWQHQLSIENQAREQVVIQSSVEQASVYGLDTASARSFFEAQIIAAKEIQQYWFDQWTTQGVDEQLTFRDLDTEIRPALLDMGDQILLTISELRLWERSPSYIVRNRRRFINALTTEGLGPREKYSLYEAATQMEGR